MIPPVTRELAVRLALFLLAGTAVFALLAFRAWYAKRAWRRPALAGGVMSALCATAFAVAYTVAIDVPTYPVPFTARFQSNPVPDTAQAAEQGRATYVTRCAVCHGPGGRGDGPAAFALNPRPLDLKVHVPLHADGELFYWIGEGVAGTQMPAFKDQLTETQRWELVRFLQTIPRS